MENRRSTLMNNVKQKIITNKSKNEVLYRMFFPNDEENPKDEENTDEFNKITKLLTDDILEHFEVSESDKNRVIMSTSDYKSTQYINGIYCLIYDYNNIKYYINYNKAV